MRVCEARWLGRVEFSEALTLQEHAVERLGNQQGNEQLILLEHPSVLTLGRGADAGNILADSTQLEWSHIQGFETGRGGDATYDRPEQLVTQPAIKLRTARPGVQHLERRLGDERC